MDTIKLLFISWFSNLNIWIFSLQHLYCLYCIFSFFESKHETIIQTAVIYQKIICSIRHSACRYMLLKLLKSLHRILNFSLRISSVNVTNSAGISKFGYIYWRNLEWTTSFFVQWILQNYAKIFWIPPSIRNTESELVYEKYFHKSPNRIFSLEQ